MDPNSLQRPKGLALILHSLAPTATGVIAYLLLAAFLNVTHLIALGVSGTAYPEHLDDEVLMGYANFIIQPLLMLVNHRLINSGLTLILWAVIGSLVAALLGAVANVLNDWRNTRNDISMPQYGVVIRHPLQHNLIMRFAWRFAIGAIIVAYTIVALFAVRYCLANNLQILGADAMVEVAWRLGLSVLVYMTLFHGYIILLRLYVQRTRIFGEILY
jgi:hypothetical protein